MMSWRIHFWRVSTAFRRSGPGPEVAKMLFVPLADFAAAQEQGASLTGLTPDGRTMEMPNDPILLSAH